jgi:hypothetical protein
VKTGADSAPAAPSDDSQLAQNAGKMAAVKNSERRPASRRGPALPEPKDVSSPDAYGCSKV